MAKYGWQKENKFQEQRNPIREAREALDLARMSMCVPRGCEPRPEHVKAFNKAEAKYNKLVQDGSRKSVFDREVLAECRRRQPNNPVGIFRDTRREMLIARGGKI